MEELPFVNHVAPTDNSSQMDYGGGIDENTQNGSYYAVHPFAAYDGKQSRGYKEYEYTVSG